MTVEEPVSYFITIEQDGCRHWSHINRMLKGCIISITIDGAKKMSVQVHGMAHHGPVYHDEAHDLTFANAYAIVFRDQLIVDEPGIAFHVVVRGQTHLPY